MLDISRHDLKKLIESRGVKSEGIDARSEKYKIRKIKNFKKKVWYRKR